MPRCHAIGRRCGTARRNGFSLVELIVVLSVALLLTGLMLPTLTHVRENAFRIVCASNQRQLGLGIFMFATDHNEQLPESSFLNAHDAYPQELMIAYRDEKVPDVADGGETHVAWDGLGLLFQQGYCSDPGCFYCPSHRGDHTLDRYEGLWDVGTPAGRIYTNFHYAGNRDWQSDRRRSLDEGESLVLTTDGLRTKEDFNHLVGMNLLAGDGSVTWRDDTVGVYESLPQTSFSNVSNVDEIQHYLRLWNIIESLVD